MTDRRDKSGPWDNGRLLDFQFSEKTFKERYPYGITAQQPKGLHCYIIANTAIENMMKVRI